MKKKFNYLILFTSSIVLLGCSYNPQDEETIKKGKATIAADESLQPVVEAEVQAYKAHYPETEFKLIFVPEQQAINLLLKDSVDIAVTTRELNKKEMVYYEQTRINYEPAILALDAVALIVNKANADTTLTIEQLKAIFEGRDKTRNLIFDNSNSSNLSYLQNKLNIKTIDNANISAANGNLDVFNYIHKNANSIGVIGNNWLSDLDNAQSVKLKESVRVLAVSSDNKNYFLPTAQNLTLRKYPLERLIYLHTNQNKWKVPKGFIRFSCSQVGQLVVEKMGLLPYYVIPKEYYLDNRSMNKIIGNSK